MQAIFEAIPCTIAEQILYKVKTAFHCEYGSTLRKIEEYAILLPEKNIK